MWWLAQASSALTYLFSMREKGVESQSLLTQNSPKGFLFFIFLGSVQLGRFRGNGGVGELGKKKGIKDTLDAKEKRSPQVHSHSTPPCKCQQEDPCYLVYPTGATQPAPSPAWALDPGCARHVFHLPGHRDWASHEHVTSTRPIASSSGIFKNWSRLPCLPPQHSTAIIRHSSPRGDTDPTELNCPSSLTPGGTTGPRLGHSAQSISLLQKSPEMGSTEDGPVGVGQRLLLMAGEEALLPVG